MAQTDIIAVQDQVQKFWSPLFMKELREALLMGALVNKEYEGEIKGLGDRVRVSQINAVVGETKTVGVDANTFTPAAMTTSKVDIIADKRFIASVEFEDLVDIQSQLGSPEGQSQIRESLMYSMMKEINDYIRSKVAPSIAAPDHLITGVANIGQSNLLSVRTLAAQAKWLRNKAFWGLLSPTYYSDILALQTMVSKDYVGDETPVVGGQIVNSRFGFNLLEDNSLLGNKAVFFHPDFLHFVMQYQPRFKLSDLHSNNKFAYTLSVDVVGGATLGIDGDLKHVVVTSALGNDFPQ